MRLGRHKRSTLGRRRRPSEDLTPTPTGVAYRSRRTQEEDSRPRRPGMPTSIGAGKGLGHFLLQRFGLVLLLLALFISMINVLSLSSDARVLSLSGSASSFLHDQSTYQSAADKLLASSIWNRNKITINTKAVSQGMLKQFPELSSASVTLPLLSKRPIVYIQTAQPALILSAQNGSFVIDTGSKALLAADKLPVSSHLNLPLVNDQSGLSVRINHQALPSSDVSFISTVAGELAARKVSVTGMTLPVGTSELDVRLANQPYIVKFNLESGTARQQAGTFLATQAKLASQHVTPAEYIDVRVDGRAYYK